MQEEKKQPNEGKTTHFGYSTVAEDKKEDQVRDVFDSVAKKYDIMNDVLSWGFHRLWKRQCIQKTQVSQGSKVLDIASGTADLAMKFAELAGPYNVTATDINHEMLSVGAQRIARKQLHCNVVEANAEDLPFASDSFDVVTVSFGIRNMTHKDRALREMLRVLKPGGRLFVLEFSQCAWYIRPFYDLYSFVIMPFLGQIIAGDKASYRYLAESIRMHPNQQAFAQLMQEAGFSDVKWHNFTFGICALHIGTKS